MSEPFASSETSDPQHADHRPLTDVCFENFSLHPTLLQGLEESGFIRCTPIQALTLPLALQGRDLTGQAQTGTGKTAAFLVAVFNRLLTQPARPERRTQDPRALVLAPTRELAIQIEKDARAIGRHTGISLALIYGGVDYDKQREALARGVDLVIATPGRLIDYVRQQAVTLRSIDIVVLDEADRMFDLGFIKDIRFLLRRTPPRGERQCLLFSATLSHRVLELAYEHMNQPEKLVVEQETVTAARVRQRVYFPANEEKIPLLIGLLTRMDAHRTMVFVNTKAWVERVARALERAHFAVGVLSGDVPQKKREQLLGRFQRGELEILVATDVAARGLHIAGVSHVFNFDLPFEAEDYVHRIGRTARLGAEGDAISFACELYATSLPDIERYIEQKIAVEPVSQELLQPQPRAQAKLLPRTESVSEAFADAPQKAAPRARRRRSGGAGRASQHQPTPAAKAAPQATARNKPRTDGQEPVASRSRRRRRRPERPLPRQVQDMAPTATSTSGEAAAEVRPGWLKRVKQGLKNWMNRLPGRGRQR